MINIRKSFSTKLSVALLILAAPIFVISLGVLFKQSRRMIRNEAIGHATSVLNATMQQLNRHLMTIETATNANMWLVEQNFTPDSLLYYAYRIVSLNPHIDGCSISAQPDMFPKYGRYFSAYSVRQSADSVSTVIEEPYDYFNKVWYKKPLQLRDACWVAYYDEVDSLELTLDGMVASYSKLLYAADSTVQARFYLFGMEPSEQKRMSHKMVVFFWLTAGQVFMPVDVSKLVWATRPDDKYVLIELDADLDLRDFLKGTPGMVVDAEDWEDTEEIQISF
jgi:hypothetical protein